MTNPTPINDDLHRGRGWLNNAADVLSQAEDTMSSAEYARIAATIGSGFVALAHAERAAKSSATLDAAAERVRRAAAEARPHDDEPEQPDGIADDSNDLPDPMRAAERVNAFLAWFGDGLMRVDVSAPPLFARDLQALANTAVERG